MRSPQSAASSDVPPSLVRAELDRILASEIFSRSDRLSAFLGFIVDQTLNGQGDSLKEQVIAEELYGKGADFSTAADPIVRVDARRLRDKLREYYASAPDDPVLISVPKGSYTPAFEMNRVPVDDLRGCSGRRRSGRRPQCSSHHATGRRSGRKRTLAPVVDRRRRGRARRRERVARCDASATAAGPSQRCVCCR